MSFGNDVDETTETKRKHAHNERVMNDPDSIIERGLRKEEQSSTLPWSSEEDRLLAQLQGKHGNKWALVAASLTKRTGQQCAQRWRHRVNPSIKREKWSKDEDEKLAELYEQHGQRWAIIARSLEGRTDQQCMGRWRRHLDPSVERGNWNMVEDEALRNAHAVHGSKWAVIAKDIDGRTAQQCRARWFQVKSGGDGGGANENKVTGDKTDAAEKFAARVNYNEGGGGKENNNKKNNKKNSNNNTNNNNAKGSLSEIFPPSQALADAIAKGSFSPVHFDAPFGGGPTQNAKAVFSTPKKKLTAGGGGTTFGNDSDGERFFAVDPSKSLTAPSTPEEKTAKPRRAKKMTSVALISSPPISPSKKRKASLSEAAENTNNNNNNNNDNNGKQSKAKANKTSNANTTTRRKSTAQTGILLARNDSYRGNEDDTLTLLCAAADRLESIFLAKEV